MVTGKVFGWTAIVMMSHDAWQSIFTSFIPILKSLAGRKKPAHCWAWAAKALRSNKVSLYPMSYCLEWIMKAFILSKKPSAEKKLAPNGSRSWNVAPQMVADQEVRSPHLFLSVWYNKISKKISLGEKISFSSVLNTKFSCIIYFCFPLKRYFPCKFWALLHSRIWF